MHSLKGASYLVFFCSPKFKLNIVLRSLMIVITTDTDLMLAGSETVLTASALRWDIVDLFDRYMSLSTGEELNHVSRVSSNT